jgi:hypothetical protein
MISGTTNTDALQIGGVAVTATPAEINAAADGIGATIPKTKIVPIVWDMDTSPYRSVYHGLTLSKIRGVTVTIINDDGTHAYTPPSFSGGAVQLWVDWIDETFVRINRLADGIFDNTDFSSTAHDRGWIVIDYVD